MNERVQDCVEMLRQLVSDVQGAPYPSEDLKLELYTIWSEHAQKAAVSCLEFLNEHFPEDKEKMDEKIDNLLL